MCTQGLTLKSEMHLSGVLFWMPEDHDQLAIYTQKCHIILPAFHLQIGEESDQYWNYFLFSYQ